MEQTLTADADRAQDSRRSPAPARDRSPAALARVIEGEIIPRLLLAHRLRPEIAAEAAAMEHAAEGVSIERFCQALRMGEPASTLEHAAWLMQRGESLEHVFLHVLAPAARRLGEMWEQDECSFTDVTVALSRLQQIVHELASIAGVALRSGSDPFAPRVLLMAAPGEQHTLGLVMLEELFAREGWAVRTEPAASRQEILSLVRRSHFDLVGVTVTCEELLALMPDLITSVRAASCNRDLRVLVGGRPFTENPDLAGSFGADGSAMDAIEAVGRARELAAKAAFA